jgi:hypothetical protein
MFYPQRRFCHSFLEVVCEKEIYIRGYGPIAYLLVRGSSFINQMMSDAIDLALNFWFLILLLSLLMAVLVQVMRIRFMFV